MHARNNMGQTWFNPGQSGRIQLICFGSDEAGPALFQNWPTGLDDHIELVTVSLPGNAALGVERTTLLHDTFADLLPTLREPHALIGHGSAGLLAWEIARLAEDRFPGQTRHLFICSCQSPDNQAFTVIGEKPKRWSDRASRSINIPLTMLFGSDDPQSSVSNIANWREFTRREFELIEMAGDSLFIISQRPRLLQIINTHLGLLSL